MATWFSALEKKHGREIKIIENAVGRARRLNKKPATKKWGGNFWRTIHFAVAAYCPKKKKEFLHFFKNVLPALIPCNSCRKHYQQNIKKLKIRQHLKSRKTLAKFVYLLHLKITDDITKRREKLDNKRVKKTFFSAKKYIKKYL